MSVSGFHREMIQNQCFVQVGQDRIEKILSSTQYQALREKWSIDLRSIKDSEVVNSSELLEQTMETPSPTGSNSAEDSQRRLPKKRLLKSFHLEEAAEQKEYHCQDYSLGCSGGISSPPPVVEQQQQVAVVKPTITNTNKLEEQESKRYCQSISKEEAEEEEKATVAEATESHQPTSPQSLDSNQIPGTTRLTKPAVSTTTHEPALQCSSPTSSLPEMMRLDPLVNGNQYQARLDEQASADRVFIHKKRKRRLSSESSNARPQSDPPPAMSESSATISVITTKRAASVESAEISANRPGAQVQKRRKRELEESYNHSEVVGTVTRICQELPRCNWLEEKILKTTAAAATTASAPPHLQAAHGNLIERPGQSVASANVWPSQSSFGPLRQFYSQQHQMVSRVLPSVVKKSSNQSSPTEFSNDEGIYASSHVNPAQHQAAVSSRPMPEATALDANAIKKAALSFLTTSSSMSNKDESRRSPSIVADMVLRESNRSHHSNHHHHQAAAANSKPVISEPINLNGTNSGGSESNSPTNYKYDYMNKNLSMRLSQFAKQAGGSGHAGNPMDINPDALMRHDLLEIDRKRKLLLEEIETIRKKKYEEIDALKRIEAQKQALLKELLSTQDAIDKHRAIMRQMDKDIMTKSRLPHPGFHPHPAQQQAMPQLSSAAEQSFRHHGNNAASGGPAGYPAHFAAGMPPPPHHIGRGGYPPPQGYQHHFPAVSSSAAASHHVHPHQRSGHMMDPGNNIAGRQQQHGFNQQQMGKQHGFPPAHLYANQRGASSSHMEPPPQQQQSSSKNPTYGGHVPAATRQPPANFSKPIVRQPNAGWIPAPEYHRRHSGDPPQHHTPVSAGLMSVMKPNGSAFSNSLASHQQGSAAVVASSGGQDRSHSSTLNRAPLESAASNGKMVMVDIFCKNCRKEANFMCSACKSVHYCSIDCQKMHWIDHSKHCHAKQQ